jgi:septum site-determining protein MinC
METVQTETLKAEARTQEKTNATTVVLKGSVFTLPIVKLSSTDLDRIEKDLILRLSNARDFFKNAPVVIDVELTAGLEPELRFSQLETLLRKHQLVPVGIQHGTERQNKTAVDAGLAIMTGQSVDRVLEAKPRAPAPTERKFEERAVGSDSAEQLPKASASVVMSEASKMIYQPIRSGQRVYAKGGDLVLLGAVNAGAEVMADGNIHIYAPLRGRALAGLDGNTEARIFCYSMEAELVAVAGNYRVFEENVPKSIYRKPVQIFLDGEQLKIDSMQ